MSWKTLADPTDIDRSDIKDEVVEPEPWSIRFPVITHYVTIVLIPHKERWEEFAENINDDVCNKLKLVDNHWQDFFDDDDL